MPASKTIGRRYRRHRRIKLGAAHKSCISQSEATMLARNIAIHRPIARFILLWPNGNEQMSYEPCPRQFQSVTTVQICEACPGLNVSLFWTRKDDPQWPSTEATV